MSEYQEIPKDLVRTPQPNVDPSKVPKERQASKGPGIVQKYYAYFHPACDVIAGVGMLSKHPAGIAIAVAVKGVETGMSVRENDWWNAGWHFLEGVCPVVGKLLGAGGALVSRLGGSVLRLGKWGGRAGKVATAERRSQQAAGVVNIDGTPHIPKPPVTSWMEQLKRMFKPGEPLTAREVTGRVLDWGGRGVSAGIAGGFPRKIALSEEWGFKDVVESNEQHLKNLQIEKPEEYLSKEDLCFAKKSRRCTFKEVAAMNPLSRNMQQEYRTQKREEERQQRELNKTEGPKRNRRIGEWMKGQGNLIQKEANAAIEEANKKAEAIGKEESKKVEALRNDLNRRYGLPAATATPIGSYATEPATEGSDSGQVLLDPPAGANE